MSRLIKTIFLYKFVIYVDQLGGGSDDEFEKIDFFPYTYEILKLVSSERAFQADQNELYGFSQKLLKIVLSVIYCLSKFLQKLFLLAFRHIMCYAKISKN